MKMKTSYVKVMKKMVEGESGENQKATMYKWVEKKDLEEVVLVI